MKVPSLLSDTFLLLTGAQPISSSERGPGAWSSWRRLRSRVLTLCRGLSGRGGAAVGGRAWVTHRRGAELRSRKDRKEGCKAPELATCAGAAGMRVSPGLGLGLGGGNRPGFSASWLQPGRRARRESQTREGTRAP